MNITIIDLETTGLDNNSEIIEIAVGNYDPYIISSRMYKPINKISPEASAINNISNRMVKDKFTFEDSINETIDLIQLYNTDVYVAHHADYDYKVLTKEMKKHTGVMYQQLNRDNWICTLELVRIMFPNIKHSLNYLKYYFELDEDTDNLPHRAESDVITTMKLFTYLINHGIENKIFDINKDLITQIKNYISENKLKKYDKWHIGKHKGKPYDQLDSDYLLWALENVTDLDQESIHFDNVFFNKVIKEFDRRIEN